MTGRRVRAEINDRFKDEVLESNVMTPPATPQVGHIVDEDAVD